MFPADPVSHSKELCWAQGDGWKPPVRVKGWTGVVAAHMGDGVHGKGVCLPPHTGKRGRSSQFYVNLIMLLVLLRKCSIFSSGLSPV